MLPDRVSNPGPLTYESGALPIALRGPARRSQSTLIIKTSGGLIINFNFLFVVLSFRDFLLYIHVQITITNEQRLRTKLDKLALDLFQYRSIPQ